MISIEKDKILNNKYSNSNQLEWVLDGIWYKKDYKGYEGLSEYIISSVLKYSNLKDNEYVSYKPVGIKYNNEIYKGCCCNNFIKNGWQIIRIEKLINNYFDRDFYDSIMKISNPKERLRYYVEMVERITGLENFGKYINVIYTIDALFLNENRHIYLLMNENEEFTYCPIFDNGNSFLSNNPKNLEDKLKISEELYGRNIRLNFNEKDVERIIDNDEIYPLEIKKRVKNILFEQMKKYAYLFK